MQIENNIPKIDLPENWIIGQLSKNDIGLLNLYANNPCRLKAGIFVLCMQGDLEASINLARYRVMPGSFITLPPGTWFIEQANINYSAMDIYYAVKDSPVVELEKQPAGLLKDYFSLLLNTYEFSNGILNNANLLNHLFSGILMGVSALKLQPVGYAELYHATKRCVVCQKAWHNAGTSQHDRQADDRQNLHRHHYLDGDHGCQGATEIDEPQHP